MVLRRAKVVSVTQLVIGKQRLKSNTNKSTNKNVNTTRKRRLTIAASLLGIALCVAVLGWFVAIPRYRPTLRTGERMGIDVSHHQGVIDWNAVRKTGIDFAYVKATEGGDYVDPMFAQNLAEATAAGLEIGAYHFFSFCRPGRVQAENFLRIAAPQANMLPPVIDIEYAGDCSKRPPRSELLREVDEFVDVVETAWGKELTVYTLDATESDYGIAKALGRPLWKRSLFRRPSDDDWIVWQISFRAKVNGVSGPVDLNLERPTLKGRTSKK
jgi:lysozyme